MANANVEIKYTKVRSTLSIYNLNDLSLLFCVDRFSSTINLSTQSRAKHSPPSIRQRVNNWLRLPKLIRLMWILLLPPLAKHSNVARNGAIWMHRPEANFCGSELNINSAQYRLSIINQKCIFFSIWHVCVVFIICRLADLFERDVNTFASLESLDNGKTFERAAGDVGAAAAALRYCAGWCDKIHGNTIPADGASFTYTRKEPVGVSALILPWNYPILLIAYRLAPALAAGCTVVVKPAEQTPLTALYTAALCVEAGFPAGVVNVVPGYGPTAGAALTGHADVKLVSFTGSLEVGRLIQEASAKSNLKRVCLELGGKSPLVIMDDVNIDEAVAIAHAGVFENHGQCCCAATRTYVHEKIYDQFVAKATALAKQRKVGNPFDKDTVQGPQVDDEMYNKVLRYIDIGKQQGAKLEVGGNKLGDVGYFIEPTVFSNVTDNMTIAREEVSIGIKRSPVSSASNRF